VLANQTKFVLQSKRQNGFISFKWNAIKL